MKIELRTNAFDPYKEIAVYEETLDLKGRVGATASFVGTMRDFNEDASVQGMWLEYYPGMTEKHIQKICDEARQKWAILDILILHRVGEISISDAIIVITVWASHRGDAMDACRYILEDLKSQAPFWKKEHLADGDRWVEGNTDGYVKSEE